MFLTPFLSLNLWRHYTAYIRSTNKHLVEVIVLGDFNARTANLNYCPSDEAVNFFNDKTVGSISCPGTDEHYRVSQDSSINSNGPKLIEVLKSTSLTILNGNTIGNVSGQFTCHVYNRSSVVDYMICSEYVISRLLKFRVHELNRLSDHCPISCNIDLRAPTSKILNPNEFEKRKNRSFGRNPRTLLSSRKY